MAQDEIVFKKRQKLAILSNCSFDLLYIAIFSNLLKLES